MYASSMHNTLNTVITSRPNNTKYRNKSILFFVCSLFSKMYTYCQTNINIICCLDMFDNKRHIRTKIGYAFKQFCFMREYSADNFMRYMYICSNTCICVSHTCILKDIPSSPTAVTRLSASLAVTRLSASLFIYVWCIDIQGYMFLILSLQKKSFFEKSKMFYCNQFTFFKFCRFSKKLNCIFDDFFCTFFLFFFSFFF